MLPPKINKKAICISTDKQSFLAQKVSKLFVAKNSYFAVFRFPELNKIKKENVKFEEDDFTGNMIGIESSILITNAIVKIDPEKYILVGLDDNQKSYFDKLPKNKIIIVDKIEDISKINNSINSNEQVVKSNHKHLVVVEDNKDLSTVIAENFSKAVNAELIFVEGTDRRILEKVSGYLHDWKGKRGKYASYVKIENLVKSRVEDINFTKYKSATFFTHGIPYGLVLENPIPFCYVHKYLRDDLFIINNIIYSQKKFGVGIIFAIDEFLHDEPSELVNIFRKNNIYPIKLFNSKANSFNFQKYLSFLPYDLVHISSHGGRSRGYYVVEKFKDRKGVVHTVEFYEIVSFSHSLLHERKDMVAVMRKAIFRKFDGFQWMSEELRKQKIPKYIYEDMRKNIFDGSLSKNAKRTPVDDEIINSCVVSCNDGTNQAMFQILAGHNSPLVFNNSCWSWGEISTFFLVGGARSYVGTLWGVELNLARDSAIRFYENVFNNKTIMESVWEINKNMTEGHQKDILFAWCLPFSTIQICNIEQDFPKFIQETIINLDRWIQKTVSSKNNELRKNSEEIVKFLIWVIYKEFNINIIETNADDVLQAYGYDLKKNSYILTRGFDFKSKNKQ